MLELDQKDQFFFILNLCLIFMEFVFKQKSSNILLLIALMFNIVVDIVHIFNILKMAYITINIL